MNLAGCSLLTTKRIRQSQPHDSRSEYPSCGVPIRNCQEALSWISRIMNGSRVRQGADGINCVRVGDVEDIAVHVERLVLGRPEGFADADIFRFQPGQ